MYEQFFSLTTLPFENTPDPRFFYASEQHREALAAIEYTIRMRKGYVLITGPVGTGKTTVGQVMRDRCGSDAIIVEVTYGHKDGLGLLKQIMRTLNIQVDGEPDHSSLVETLKSFLIDQLSYDRPVVLFVDEAQTLGDETLEELRLMSNLDTTTAKAIQIVLVGQPELRHRLRDQKHAALRQRIVMAKQLEPLNAQATATYINHRIAAASTDPQNVGVTFTIDAIDTIYQYANGIPRLINVACDNCLLMGYVQEQTQISSSIVHKVVAEMIPSLDGPFAGDDLADRPALALAGGL